MRRFGIIGGAVVSAALFGSTGAQAQDQKPETKVDFEAVLARSRGGAEAGGGPSSKFRDFQDVMKGAEKIEGLFTLYRKDDHLYADIKPFQLDQPLLAPMMVSKGMASVGSPLNFGDEWVLVFRREGDKIQLIRRNIHYKGPDGTPLGKAVKQNYTDSVLMALPIVTLNPMGGMSPVIDLSDIFLSNFAELPFGFLDRNRSSWHKVKAFPNNLELQVELTFGGGGRAMMGMGGDSGVADPRGVTLVVHYSLMRLPDPGYRPRVADSRVGFFLNATKDFGVDDPDTQMVRYINRWRLEKADPRAKLSPPKKRIIWWIEDTVPDEYRPAVLSGIEEWNKAFEKIGFRNAIEVRWQNGRDEFDPEDTNYCTFRWITTGRPFAMSGLRSNPLTGELIDGDVIFDASMIRFWKQEYGLMANAAVKDGQGLAPIAIGEVISPIMAARQGYGLPTPLFRNGREGANGDKPALEVLPANWSPIERQLRQRMAGGLQNSCQYASGMQYELGLAAIALADAAKGEPDPKLSEEFLAQAIKEVVMHEVGHSLGLRHNFKASTMLTADQLHDTAITRAKGLVGSVMDYNPINIAPKGKKQGDFYTTTIGPYDYWAIEYAYKPVDGMEEVELKKIAARGSEADLAFSTDEDMFGNNDPNVNVWDLGSDTCKFAMDRMALAAELMKDLDGKVVKNGESWARTRQAFSILLNQWGNAADLIASQIGGQSINRDHKGDKNGRDPIVPISGAKQRECLKMLADEILSDKAFKFSPALLRRLGTEKWTHWGSDQGAGGVDFPINERVLGIQKIALGQCLSGGVLARLQNQELQADEGTNPLRVSEVFRALTEGVWGDVGDASGDKKDKSGKLAMSTIRRNLQREYLRRLSTMVLGSSRPAGGGDMFLFMLFQDSASVPADARALARLHLKEIHGRIGKTLDQRDLAVNDTTRAHLEESRHRIAKVLEAGLNSNEP